METETPTRRGFLTACAGLLAAGVAGCSAAPGSDGESPASTPEPDASLGDESAAVEQLSRSEDEDSPYVAAYRATYQSVARIRVYTQSGTGGGTGWLYDESHLVTNQHVVDGASDVYVRFPEGGWTSASVVASDVYSDLAVLSVEETPESATPLTLLSEDPAVGTEVIAIGNPFQRTGSVSAGIVSGTDRTLRLPNNFSIPDAIQTDAAVNPGNSGGPLVTLDGDVVGVINAGSGDNVGFAISGALTRRVVPALIEDGEFDHSYMGVRLRSVDPLHAEVNDLEEASGVYIHEVVSNSPSDGVFRGSTETVARNGVSNIGVGGDVIVAMEDTPIPQQEALSSFLALETSPGDTIEVTVIRDGEERTVDLTLGERPEL